MTTLITVKHNFETAHRLPFLGGKCENLHGHSWWAEFGITNLKHDLGVDGNGIAAEYSEVKTRIRQFIDEHLDHGTMLGAEDPFFTTAEVDALHLLGKVFIFGDTSEWVDPAPLPPGYRYNSMPWPTVEAVAQMLCDKVQEELNVGFGSGTLYVDHVKVQETHVNGVTFGND